MTEQQMFYPDASLDNADWIKTLSWGFAGSYNEYLATTVRMYPAANLSEVIAHVRSLPSYVAMPHTWKQWLAEDEQLDPLRQRIAKIEGSGKEHYLEQKVHHVRQPDKWPGHPPVGTPLPLGSEWLAEVEPRRSRQRFPTSGVSARVKNNKENAGNKAATALRTEWKKRGSSLAIMRTKAMASAACATRMMENIGNPEFDKALSLKLKQMMNGDQSRILGNVKSERDVPAGVVIAWRKLHGKSGTIGDVRVIPADQELTKEELNEIVMFDFKASLLTSNVVSAHMTSKELDSLRDWEDVGWDSGKDLVYMEELAKSGILDKVRAIDVNKVVLEEIASNYIGAWVGTSSDHHPVLLAMQQIISEEFLDGNNLHKLPKGKVSKTDEILLRAFVHAEYDETQEYLKNKGITSITVSRGMNLSQNELEKIKSLPKVNKQDKEREAKRKSAIVDKFAFAKMASLSTDKNGDQTAFQLSITMRRIITELEKTHRLTLEEVDWQLHRLVYAVPEKSLIAALGDDKNFEFTPEVSVTLQPASSWALNKGVSDGFGNHVFTAEIPSERILATPLTGMGCLHETELVSLGGVYQDVSLIGFDPAADSDIDSESNQEYANRKLYENKDAYDRSFVEKVGGPKLMLDAMKLTTQYYLRKAKLHPLDKKAAKLALNVASQEFVITGQSMMASSRDAYYPNAPGQNLEYPEKEVARLDSKATGRVPTLAKQYEMWNTDPLFRMFIQNGFSSVQAVAMMKLEASPYAPAIRQRHIEARLESPWDKDGNWYAGILQSDWFTASLQSKLDLQTSFTSIGLMHKSLMQTAFDLEVKSILRHVRTAAGVRRYKQPIGSIIIVDSVMKHINHLRPLVEEHQGVSGGIVITDDRNRSYTIDPVDDNGIPRWKVGTGTFPFRELFHAPTMEDALLRIDSKLSQVSVTTDGDPRLIAERLASDPRIVRKNGAIDATPQRMQPTVNPLKHSFELATQQASERRNATDRISMKMDIVERLVPPVAASLEDRDDVVAGFVSELDDVILQNLPSNTQHRSRNRKLEDALSDLAHDLIGEDLTDANREQVYARYAWVIYVAEHNDFVQSLSPNAQIHARALRNSVGSISRYPKPINPWNNEVHKAISDSFWEEVGSQTITEAIARSTVSVIIASWAASSTGNAVSLNLQDYVHEHLAPGSKVDHIDRPLGATQSWELATRFDAVYPAFIAATYAETQRHLPSVDSIYLYRGMHFDTGDAKDWGLPEEITSSEVKAAIEGRFRDNPNLLSYTAEYLDTDALLSDEAVMILTDELLGMRLPVVRHTAENPQLPVVMQPLSAWTWEENMAGDFSEHGDLRVVLTADIPRDAILSSAISGQGCLNEQEVVVIGGEYLVTAYAVIERNITPDQISEYLSSEGDIDYEGALRHRAEFIIRENARRSLRSLRHLLDDQENPETRWSKTMVQGLFDEFISNYDTYQQLTDKYGHFPGAVGPDSELEATPSYKEKDTANIANLEPSSIGLYQYLRRLRVSPATSYRIAEHAESKPVAEREKR